MTVSRFSSVRFLRSRRQPHRPGAARRGMPVRLGLVTVIGVLLGATPVASFEAPPAEAAVLGQMVFIGGWPIGTFLSSTGEYVYCIEPGASEPSSGQGAGRALDALPAYSGTSSDVTGWSGSMSSGPLVGERLRQVNYVLWEHGRTSDSGTAAAVQLAIWMLRADPGAQAWLDHHLAWLNAHGGASYVELGRQLADEARSRARAAEPPQPAPLVVEASAEKVGTANGVIRGRVRYPAGTTEVSIEGGRFADGSTTAEISSIEPGELAWTAAPHEDGWAGAHRIDFSANWSITSTGWSDATLVFDPEVPGQQRLAAGIARATETFTGELDAFLVADAEFEPMLSTRVPEVLVSEGESFSDEISVSVSEGSDPWPRRELAPGQLEYAPIRMLGTLYGPFDRAPGESPEPPRDAPVAGRAEVIANAGPGEYTVRDTGIPVRPGYYSWVWRIRADEQDDAVRPLLATDYEYADHFGLTEEGQIAPMRLRWETSLEQRTVRSDGGVLEDRLTIDAADSMWFRGDDGEPLPIRLRLTAYHTQSSPEPQSVPAEDARAIADAVVDVAAEGVHPEAVPLTIPAFDGGWITVQTCLRREDQIESVRDLVEEWCDDFGLPDETAAILVDELSATGGEQHLGAVPLVGAVVAYAGVNTLLIGLLLRRRRAGQSK